MATWLRELRERLLQAGVAPRHVRRYLTELREHWTDLTAEEERAGRKPAEAEALALARLGKVDDLARTMMERPELRLVDGAGSMGSARRWSGAWAGSGVECGAADSVVGRHVVSGRFADALCSAPWVRDRLFRRGQGALLHRPLLTGWGMILLAARQRVQAVWPVILGSLVVALLGATGNVDVRPPSIPGDSGDVGIQFYPLLSQLPDSAGRALLLFVLVALPYLVWRWRSSPA